VADGQRIQASRSSTKVGWNAGLGLEFGNNGRSSWFVESRYHSAQGKHSVQFLPLQFGYRF
jgi:hypothetical protein